MRLMIVDDSALMRRVLYDLLSADSSIEIVGSAGDGEEALDLIPNLKPEIITMDVNMPKMNGITTLKHIMIKHPMPVIMISAFTVEGADITFESLRFGAIDFITKPSKTNPEALRDQRNAVIDKVKHASKINTNKIKHIRLTEDFAEKKSNSNGPANKVLFFNTSTGGYSSLLQIIPWISAEKLDTSIVVQTNISQEFIKPFIKYLNKFSSIDISLPASHEPLKTGVCYINPEGIQLSFEKKNHHIFTNINEIPPHMSSYSARDITLFSLVEALGNEVKLVLLSGEKNIGVDTLKEIKRNDGKIIAQSPDTCLESELVDFAIRNNYTDMILTPKEIFEGIKLI